MRDQSVDSVVTDPPYGLSDHKPADVVACLTAWLAGKEYRPNKKGFMGRTWDNWVPGPEVWREVFRVLKPGGHVIAFAGSRTHDLMSMALRLAGFECRDTIMDLYATSEAAREFVDSLSDEQRKALATALPADIGVLWTYGSGFPKSMDVSKVIDKAAGAEREVVGRKTGRAASPVKDLRGGRLCEAVDGRIDTSAITAPATDAARQWSGWGTALKPAFEPALLFRKPLSGTVAANVLAHGTGALNIDGCRVAASSDQDKESYRTNCASVVGLGSNRNGNAYGEWAGKRQDSASDLGRFPANLIHDGSPEVLALFPDSDGAGPSLPRVKVTGFGSGAVGSGASDYLAGDRIPYNAGSGSAARFFYCTKASRADRNEGLPVGGDPAVGIGASMSEKENADWKARNGNHHPTVKPTDLMRYLCRLVTPPGGVVLDPFTGSGSTGKSAILEGFQFIGCELDAEYLEIARARIEHAAKQRRDSLAQGAFDFEGQPQRGAA